MALYRAFVMYGILARPSTEISRAEYLYSSPLCMEAGNDVSNRPDDYRRGSFNRDYIGRADRWPQD
jgi:hypothetical protein